jgi:hypothetical protein
MTDEEKPKTSDTTAALQAVLERAQKVIPEIEAAIQRVSALADAAQKTHDEIALIKEAVIKEASAVRDSKTIADQEARQAAKAKENCEEHAAFISKKRGAAEVDLGVIGSSKTTAEANVQTIAGLKGIAETEKGAIGEARTRADQVLKEIIVLKSNSESAAAGTATKLKEAEGSQIKATASADAATKAESAAKSATTSVTQLLADIEKTRSNAAELLTAITTHKTTTEQHESTAATEVESIKTTVTLVKDTRSKVDAYETELARMKTAFDGTTKQVVDLLPHAASASLASSFRQQKERFKNPQAWWLKAFGVSLVGLFSVAVYAAIQGYFSDTPDSWDGILRHLVQHLPLAAPFLWGAFYSGRQYIMAIRLEEDYAYKESLSTAFEGYKRELSTIQGISQERLHPLVRMCENVLGALAERPGRIYEAKPVDITPMTALAESTEHLASAAEKLTGNLRDTAAKSAEAAVKKLQKPAGE